MNDTILINRLPTRTWNRLGVNETAIAWGQADDLGEEKITAAGQTERLEITGSGERSEKAVDIHAPAGQTVTVFETLRAEKGLLVRTALHVEKDAKVRLVQIQNAAQGSLLRMETSGECAENGQVELIQVLLGRGDVYSDGHFELNGNGAGFTAGIGYLGQKQQTVDMNLVVNHWGQKTTSEINAAVHLFRAQLVTVLCFSQTRIDFFCEDAKYLLFYFVVSKKERKEILVLF